MTNFEPGPSDGRPITAQFNDADFPPMLDATPLFRLYARWRLRRLRALDPVATQRDQLDRLIRHARDTRFGRDHRFERIGTVAEYQAAVPLRRYEDFHQAYWKESFPHLRGVTWPESIPYFAVTSGTTTDVTKYIPVSRSMLRSNQRAALDLLVHHYANKPDTRLFGGRNMMLGGSTDLRRLAPGVESGDLSGIAAKAMSFWARPRAYPPLRLALIEDWERKLNALAEGAAREDIRSIGGTPSWLLILFDRMAELHPDTGRRLPALWPNLELLVHGGVNFEPYKPQFDRWLEGGAVDLREAFAASEGFIASSDRGYGEGLRLNVDHGLFFEFVPVEELDSENPTRHWLGTVETGVNYALVLTTCAGLWAWVIGDTVRFVERDPPRLLVTGRTAFTLSAFGEHLIDAEIEEAIAGAAKAVGGMVTDYSVGALFPDEERRLGRHLYVAEFALPGVSGEAIEGFAAELDTRLQEINEDYAAHRAGGIGLDGPAVLVMPAGGFADWMKRRGKLGGQNKVPRVINDVDLFEDLCAFARERAKAPPGN